MGRAQRAKQRLDGLETEQHARGFLVLLRGHADMLGHRMDIAQGSLQGAVSMVGAASGQRVHELDSLGRSMRGMDRRQENLRPGFDVGGRTPAPLVGRGPELTQLRQSLARAAADHGQVVAIVGSREGPESLTEGLVLRPGLAGETGRVGSEKGEGWSRSFRSRGSQSPSPHSMSCG